MPQRYLTLNRIPIIFLALILPKGRHYRNVKIQIKGMPPKSPSIKAQKESSNHNDFRIIIMPIEDFLYSSRSRRANLPQRQKAGKNLEKPHYDDARPQEDDALTKKISSFRPLKAPRFSFHPPKSAENHSF
jgi:hypothetical protein